MSSAVWLSWENHRRSREMSRALEVPFRNLGGPNAPLLYPATGVHAAEGGDRRRVVFVCTYSADEPLEAVIYVHNDPVSIAEGVRRLYSAKPFFDRHAEDLVHSLNRDWSARFDGLRAAVEPQEVPA